MEGWRGWTSSTFPTSPNKSFFRPISITGQGRIGEAKWGPTRTGRERWWPPQWTLQPTSKLGALCFGGNLSP